MQYINANDILPENLLQQIQQYVSGSIIYIPQNQARRKNWGVSTNCKNRILERNSQIRERKQNGASIDELISEYHLSYDAIKSILYRKV